MKLKRGGRKRSLKFGVWSLKFGVRLVVEESGSGTAVGRIVVVGSGSGTVVGRVEV